MACDGVKEAQFAVLRLVPVRWTARRLRVAMQSRSEAEWAGTGVSHLSLRSGLGGRRECRHPDEISRDKLHFVPVDHLAVIGPDASNALLGVTPDQLFPPTHLQVVPAHKLLGGAVNALA